MRTKKKNTKRREEEEEAFEDEIMTMVNVGEQEGLLEADAREMIEGVQTGVLEMCVPPSSFFPGWKWERERERIEKRRRRRTFEPGMESLLLVTILDGCSDVN